MGYMKAQDRRDDQTRCIAYPANIPLLPRVVEGRTLFNKASDRRWAMLNGTATEPVGVAPLVFVENPAKGKSDKVKKGPKYHLQGSTCVAMYYHKWSWETRDRILNGADFQNLPKDECCSACLHHFENT